MRFAVCAGPVRERNQKKHGRREPDDDSCSPNRADRALLGRHNRPNIVPSHYYGQAVGAEILTDSRLTVTTDVRFLCAFVSLWFRITYSEIVVTIYNCSNI